MPIAPRNAPGSRLFNQICGHPRGETEITGFYGTIQSGSPPGIRYLVFAIRFGPLDRVASRPRV
jgi:hypothetical protein